MSDPIVAAIIGACALLLATAGKEIWSNTGQRKQKKRETNEKMIDEALRLGVGQYVAMMPPLPVAKPTLIDASVNAIRPLLVAHLDCSVSVISERLKALRETMLQPNDEFVVAMFPALTWFNQWCKAQIPTLLAMRREMGFRWFRSDQEELCRAWDTHFGFIDKWLRDHSERLIASGQLPVPGNSTAPPSTTPQG